jgi:predicted helicase
MAKKITLKEIGDMLEYVVKHMATKDELHEVKTTVLHVQGQVNSIEQELKLGRYETRLGNLETKVFGSAHR